MRMTILVAIATLILGLGSMYTTAKASQSPIYDPASLIVMQTPKVEVPAMFNEVSVPLPDPLLELEKRKEAEVRDREVNCLAHNIYFEARGESKKGKIAVGQVTINRVKAGKFVDSICGVVHQHKGDNHKQPFGCQFSWFCDGTKHKVLEQETFADIKTLAEDLYDNFYIGDTFPDLVHGALYFERRFAGTPCRGKLIVACIDNQVYKREVAKL